MRILYLDCGMGAAGDMLMSALLELVPDKDKFVEKINNIGISNVKVKLESSVKCGIKGNHVRVLINDEEECLRMYTTVMNYIIITIPIPISIIMLITMQLLILLSTRFKILQFQTRLRMM